MNLLQRWCDEDHAKSSERRLNRADMKRQPPVGFQDRQPVGCENSDNDEHSCPQDAGAAVPFQDSDKDEPNAPPSYPDSTLGTPIGIQDCRCDRCVNRE